jgi:hypothetical protein
MLRFIPVVAIALTCAAYADQTDVVIRRSDIARAEVRGSTVEVSFTPAVSRQMFEHGRHLSLQFDFSVPYAKDTFISEARHVENGSITICFKLPGSREVDEFAAALLHGDVRLRSEQRSDP